MRIKTLTFAAMAAALTLGLASCGTKITPETTTISGGLTGAFEVVDTTYDVTAVEGTDMNRVDIKIRRTDETVPYGKETKFALLSSKTADANMLAGFGVVVMDKDGKEVYTLSPLKMDSKSALDVLKLANGAEGTLTVQLPKDIKPATFKVGSGLKFLKSGEVKLDGAIGKYGISMKAEMNVPDEVMQGSYSYNTNPAGCLWFKGQFVESKKSKPGRYVFETSLIEDNGAGMMTGTFEGTMELVRESPMKPYRYVYRGDFTNFRGQTFMFDIRSEEIK